MRQLACVFASVLALTACTESPSQHPTDGGVWRTEGGALVVEAGLLTDAGLITDAGLHVEGGVLTDAGLISDAGLHTEGGIIPVDAATPRPDMGPLDGRCVGKVCWEAPWPQGNTLLSVWGSGPNEVVAVGAVGSVVRFDGSTLSAERAPTAGTMMALWGASKDELFSLVTGPRLARYDGALWSVVEEPTLGATHPLAIWGTSATDVFAAGSGGVMTHFDGAQWKAMEMNTRDRIEAIWGTAPDQVWAVSFSDHLWRYDGTQWKEIIPDLVIDTIPWAYLGGADGVYASSPQNLYLSGRHIYHFNGNKWSYETLDDPGGGPMWGSGATEIYTIRTGAEPFDKGRVWRYDGSSWKALPVPPLRSYLNGLWGDGKGTIYVVGDDGLFARHSATAGWELLSRDHGDDTNAIWGSSATMVFAGRADGKLMRRQGTSWVEASYPGTKAINGLWGLSTTSIYAAADDGLWRYDGSNWKKQTVTIAGFAGTARFPGPIWGRGETDLYAAVQVENNGAVTSSLAAHYDGQSWSALPPEGTYPHALFGFASGEVFAAGQSGSVSRIDGTSWTTFPMLGATLDLRALWGTSPSDVYAAGTHMSKGGQIFHYDGSLWSEMTLPAGVGTINAIWGHSATEIYAVGGLRSLHGVLLRYDGATWEAIYYGIGHDLLSVWGAGSGDVFLGGRKGAILHKQP